MIARDTVAPVAPSRAARLSPVFVVVAAGVVMSNLDTFVVNVALAPIATHFHATLTSVSWVLDAYAVIFAALLVPAGSLADRFGARLTYLAGIAVFTAASLASCLAPGVWWLVGFRVLQAAGAAALIPSSLGLLFAAAPPAKRVTAVRAWTAISGLAAALGPALGGLLTDASWRWVFLINVPIGIAALLAGPRVLPQAPARNRIARPDITGAAVLTVGIGALALGVVQSSDWGWTSARIIGALAAGVVFLALFVGQSTRHPSPVLPLALLRVRSFAPASLTNALFAIPFAAMLLSAVLWTQDVWHCSPLLTGLAIAPGPLMVPVFALAVGPPLAKHLGAAAVAFAGCLFFAGGIVWWITQMHARPDYLQAMFPGMILTGIGVGLTLPTLIGVGVSALPPQAFSTGSGVITMARQLGSVFGVAILIAILDTIHTTADAVRVFDHAWWFTVAATGASALACLSIEIPTKGTGTP